MKIICKIGHTASDAVSAYKNNYRNIIINTSSGKECWKEQRIKPIGQKDFCSFLKCFEIRKWKQVFFLSANLCNADTWTLEDTGS